MSNDRAAIDPELFGMAVELPSIPVRIRESKPEKAEEARLKVDYTEQVATPAAQPAGWRDRLAAKLSFRPNA